MNSGANDSQLMSDINVTPFVDVMLVLLIIFMVTAPMMVQGVDVALPETTSGPLPADQEHLIVSVDDRGRVYINDFEVGLEGLKQKLANILAGQTQRPVYLKADKQIPYGLVATVMAEIKGAGVGRLGLVTQPDDGKRKKGG